MRPLGPWSQGAAAEEKGVAEKLKGFFTCLHG